jgi:hypothetical protein
MKKFIEGCCGAGPIDSRIESGYYELYTPEDTIIQPAVWEEMVEDVGEVIKMRWLEPPPSIPSPPSLSTPTSPMFTPVVPPPNTPPPPASLEITGPSAEHKALFATESNVAQSLEEKKRITLISAAGDKYSLPFNICETWEVCIVLDSKLLRQTRN